MNYPESSILTSLRTAIIGKIAGRNVYTVPPKSLSYPYIWLSQPFTTEVGPKGKFIYRVEILIQVIHKDISSLTPLLSDMQKVHEIINNGADLAVTGYTVIEVNLLSTNRTEELTDAMRLDIGLIRIQIDLK
jgi:hypothetical protein